MMRAAGFLALALTASVASAAQPIGRLFFTPGERAQLDVARATKRTAEPPAPEKSAEPPKPETQIITYNGIVRRSDGKSILWLNSRAVDEKEALSGLPVTGRVRPDGRVTLQTPDGGGTIELRVGQRAELTTGRVSEARPPEKEKEAAAERAAKDPKGDTAKGSSTKADKDPPRADAKAPAKAAETDRKAEPAKGAEAEGAPRAAAK